jgi:putative membrane protein
MCSHAEKVGLVVLAVAAFVLLGIAPRDRATWALENLVPVLEGLALVLYYRWAGVELTRLCYYLVVLHLVIQMIGGHYSYAEVPLFNHLRDRFGWSRNHYDRVGHLAVGFCLFHPIREICLRSTPLAASRGWSSFFALMTIIAIAAVWEVWEWIVAVTAHPELGTAFLGAQGDPWDAQKDILLAPLGAVVAAAAFTHWHNRLLEQGHSRAAPVDSAERTSDRTTARPGY